MTDVLRDVVRHGTAVGSVGSRINFPAGGKTGTTNDGFDVWYIGFTPDLVTGVWIGFDQPKKIKSNAQGGVLAAPAWTAMMREVYERRAIPPAWPRPDGLTALDIDKTTGYKATPFCPKDVHYIESFIPGTEPTPFCPIHSPFGSVGGVMGGSGRARPTAPRLRRHRRSAPLPPSLRPRRAVSRGPAGRRASRRLPPRDRRHGRNGPLSDLAVGMRPCRLRAEWVLPMAAPPIAGGAVLIGADGRIEAVGPDRVVPLPPDAVEGRYDGSLLLPGLINTHTHLELTGLAGGPPEPDFTGWILGVRQAKAARSAEAVDQAARQGVGECWAAGVTTVADTGDSGAVIAALAALGGSGIVYHEVFGPHPGQVERRTGRAPVGGRPARPVRHRPGADRGLAPRTLHREQRTVRRDLGVRRGRRPAAGRASGRVAGGGGAAGAGGAVPSRKPGHVGRSPFRPAGAVAGRMARYTRRSGRADPVHSRGPGDGRGSRSPGPPRGCRGALPAQSNRAHGHGDAPLQGMLRRGLRVGVGTDSVLSVGVVDLLAEARAARVLGALDAPARSRCARRGRPRAIGLASEIGSLSRGGGGIARWSGRGRRGSVGRGARSRQRSGGCRGHLSGRKGRYALGVAA